MVDSDVLQENRLLKERVAGYEKYFEMKRKKGKYKELRKGRSKYHTQFYCDSILQLELNKNECALLLQLCTCLEFGTNYIVDQLGNRMNQAAIGKMMDWDRWQAGKVLSSIEGKNLIFKELQGKSNAYKLNSQYFNRGKQNKKQRFIKVFIKALESLLLTLETKEKALLFRLLPYIQPNTNFLVANDGRRLNKKGIISVIGWSEDTTEKWLNSLLKKHSVISKRKYGQSYIYFLNTDYFYSGDNPNGWLDLPEVRAVRRLPA